MANKQPTGYYDPTTGIFVSSVKKKKHTFVWIVLGMEVLKKEFNVFLRG
ncbi:MAG: hypothetical protein IK132_09005 [Clostridia bacterium]|nr:hypothetical protein [Clostridia bacterium]